MNCKEIKKMLNPYIEKALDADISRQIEEHLKSCPSCNKEYQNLKKIIASLNSLSPQPAPTDFTQSLMTKISQEEIQIQTSWIDHLKKRISIPQLSFRLAGAAAITALVMFFAFTFIFNTPNAPAICSAEVQFSLRISDDKTHTVAIAGDFNGWDPQANTLEDPEEDGIWTCLLYTSPSPRD